jgi:hypothetical protein
MDDSVVGSARDTVDSSVQRVSGGAHTAVDTTAGAAYRTDSGVGEVRSAIRAQPITAALVVFALGYLFGRLGALIPTGKR